MRFRLKTDENLVYNQKITVKVCVISLSSVIKKGNIIIYSLDCKNFFMKKRIFKKLRKPLVMGSLVCLEFFV